MGRLKTGGYDPLAAKEIVASDVTRKLDHEPRIDAGTAFDVTLLYGVFRGSRSFDLPCGAIRRLVTATMIADRDQRLLELSADGQASRVRAADTSARGHDPCRHKPHLRALAGTVPSSGGPKRPPLPT